MPYLCSNLVAALAGLDVDDFTHGGCRSDLARAGLVLVRFCAVRSGEVWSSAGKFWQTLVRSGYLSGLVPNAGDRQPGWIPCFQGSSSHRR